jgi:hypothetical protein
MRVLRDECVPRPLRRELAEHDVKTVQEVGWAGTRNGALLKLVRQAGLDAFVTADRRIEHQQNIAAAQVPLVVLVAASNRLQALLPLIPQLKNAIARVKPGDVIHCGAGPD